MVRLLADENFNNHILNGLRRDLATLEIERVQDCELLSALDNAVLEWAARHGYVVVTHDNKTMAPIAAGRVANALPMNGLIVVSGRMPPGEAIEQLSLLLCCYEPAEMSNNIVHLPF